MMQRRTALLALLGAPSAFCLPERDDEEFLDDLSRRSFRYFVEQADPGSGLVLDRARSDGSPVTGASRNVASIAATGFGLTALSLGAERGWIERGEALKRARATLAFFADDAKHEHGWFYHFVDASNGARAWNCEIGSIDNALLLAGILTARRTFPDPAIERAARVIWERVDFDWMRNGDSLILNHGWKPESGFLRYRWDRYSESILLYLLGLASPSHPLPPKSWYGWDRPRIDYKGYSYIHGGSLFTHQFPQGWADLRGLRDRPPSGVDYFQNSVTATRAHRVFCQDLAARFPKSYSEHVWGISASDSAKGYMGWGGPPDEPALDGTVAPYAAAGSLMFTPDISIPALRTMRDRFGDRIYGRYGFCDAFNPTTGWVGSDVLGIDLGITILSAANLRDGAVWRLFMANPEIGRALELAGFQSSSRGRRPQK